MRYVYDSSVDYRYNATDYIKINTFRVAVANDEHLSKYGLTVDALCLALTGEPRDIFFDLHG